MVLTTVGLSAQQQPENPVLDAAGRALALDPRLLWAAQPELITRAVPSTGERLPVVGLGSSATFAQVASSEDVSAVRGVLRTMVEQGGRVFDTTPSYGASEEVAGRIAREENLTDRIFGATKVNVASGGQSADPAAARQADAVLQSRATPLRRGQSAPARLSRIGGSQALPALHKLTVSLGQIWGRSPCPPRRVDCAPGC